MGLHSKPAVDGGYAWVVAIACFAVSFIMSGLARAAGVLFVAIIDLYGVSRETATAPFSIRFSVRNMIGPLVGLLGQRFGIRAITIAGGILAGVGGTLCGFAPGVSWLTIFWGGVHGFGYGLCTLIHVLILNQYFVKYKATALGFALSGDCFGTFAFPIIIEFLLEKYGVNGTFLILGGIVFNVVPAGLLMKSPDWLKEDTKDTDSKEPGYYSEISKTPPLFLISKVPFVPDYFNTRNQNDKEQIHLKSYLHIEDGLSENRYYDHNKDASVEGYNSLQYTQDFVPNRRIQSAISLKIVQSDNENAYNDTRGNDFSALSGKQLLGDKAQQNIILVRNNKQENNVFNPSKFKTEINPTENIIIPLSVGIIPTVALHNITIAQLPGSQGRQHNIFIQFLITNTRPMFLLTALTLAFYYILFLTVVTIIIDYAADNGIPIDVGKYLIISFSVADLFGRLGLGSILDKKWIKFSHFTGLTSVLMGLFVLVMPLCSNFYYLMTCMALYGFVQGGNAIIYPILVGEYMDKKEESVALGCLNFFGGLLMLPLPSMIGYFRDIIGSYDGVFFTFGSLSMMAGFLWLLEPCIWEIQQRKSKKSR